MEKNSSITRIDKGSRITAVYLGMRKDGEEQHHN
jgi:hypothetical protein